MEEDILLKLENVEICREENRVLHDACLTLRNGEFVYVIGKVGSGKSSLLKSLYCEIPILRGEARIMDYNLTKMKRKDIPYLRRKLGIVFQDFQLLTDRSVSKNLEFVLKATGWKKKSECPFLQKILQNTSEFFRKKSRKMGAICRKFCYNRRRKRYCRLAAGENS